jgi:hypothetical protein
MVSLHKKALQEEPLVFMNACSSAQGDRVFHSMFLTYFVRHWRARGFIGTDWKIPTIFADAFARRVLDEFLGGDKPIGRVFNEAIRSCLADLQNPFPLIYALYCRPEITVRP